MTEIHCENVQEVLSLLKLGNKHRTKEPTHANEFSSRSHAIVGITVESKDKSSGIKE